jgi:hypothetical protein
VLRTRRITLLALVALAGISAAPADAAKRGPLVRQLVVFKSGALTERAVRASATSARVGRRHCAVGRSTPLAALLRSRPGSIGLQDYGSCGRRAGDSGGLYVRRIRRDRARGQDGWVYKVGRRLATAGAADPAGPFGRGRLRSRQRVTWFFCRITAGSCQRTLELDAAAQPAGAVVARVRGYDDEGRGVAIAGAEVRGGGATATTGPDGRATLVLARGTHSLRARAPGLVTSFAERVVVR